MTKKLFTPIILALLAYGFWVSPYFKEIAFGLALFIFGMLALEDGFRAFTGGIMERLLRRTTNRLWKALTFGAVTTTMMQSSGLVAVITISFLSAGLLTLKEGMGIILGANIGTSSSGWIMALLGLKVEIATLAMPLLVFGVVLIFQKEKPIKGIGYVLAGLGFYLLGIHHIKTGFDAFGAKIDLNRYAVTGVIGLLQYTLIGLVATTLLQSSHAAIVLIITALSAGQITFENGVALVIGANIGTTTTAIFGAIGANEEGKRLTLSHVTFNLVTALWVMGFVHQVTWLSDAIGRPFGITKSDTPLRLAMFHTLFNVLVVVTMAPLRGQVSRLLEKIIKPPKIKIAEPKFLNAAAVDFPDTAVEAVRKELVSMFEDALKIISATIGLKFEEILAEKDLTGLAEKSGPVEPYPIDEAYRTQIKEIFAAVIEFISRATFSWHETQSQRLYWMRNAGRHMVEAVKAAKHLQKNLVAYSSSPNPHQRAAYQGIRLEIAGMIKELEYLLRTEDKDVLVISLDNLKLAVAEIDQNLLQKIYGLINDAKITGPMGTSLINDYGYASEIITNLVDAAGTLYAEARYGQLFAQRAVSLDRGELNRLAGETVKAVINGQQEKSDEDKAAT